MGWTSGGSVLGAKVEAEAEEFFGCLLRRKRTPIYPFNIASVPTFDASKLGQLSLIYLDLLAFWNLYEAELCFPNIAIVHFMQQNVLRKLHF